MGNNNDGKEIPLRGWKQITEFMQGIDYRTAKRILIEKRVLHYEARTPVLWYSEYCKTFKRR